MDDTDEMEGHVLGDLFDDVRKQYECSDEYAIQMAKHLSIREGSANEHEAQTLARKLLEVMDENKRLGERVEQQKKSLENIDHVRQMAQRLLKAERVCAAVDLMGTELSKLKPEGLKQLIRDWRKAKEGTDG